MDDVLGTPRNPYVEAPPEWDLDGLPYAAFCRCAKCGYVGRSTASFDYYADGPGDPLTCESCMQGRPIYVLDQLLDEKIESGELPPDPLGPGSRGESRS